MAEQINAPEMRKYSIGIAEAPCEITPKMQAVMDANWRAIQETMRSPFDPSVPVCYRVGKIDALQA